MLMRAEDTLADHDPEPLPEFDPQFEGMPACEVEVTQSDSPIAQDENADAMRRHSAVTLVDPDTYGYLLFVLKKPSRASEVGEVDVSGFVRPEWWPAFIDMLNQSSKAGLDIVRGNT